MSLEYYIAGCVLAGLCGFSSGIIAACCWIAGRVDDAMSSTRSIREAGLGAVHHQEDLTAEDLL